jgi:hypothetical protein
MISQQELKELLDYDPAVGQLVWKVRRNSFGGKIKPGVVAGCIGTHGYRLIRVQGLLRHAHQWVWYWHKGEWPDKASDIDHVNANRDDNRIENLRQVSRAQNMWNQDLRVDNTSGVIGVGFDRRREKWFAVIKADKERFWLGYYQSYEAAVAARKGAEALLHGTYRRQKRKE